MTGEYPLVYDEAALKERVAGLPEPERTLLAAACAERLMPLYGWIASTAGSAEAASIRSALDLAWSASASAKQAEQAQLEVEELVPDEDDEDAPVDVALVQNAIAAVAYALRTAGCHDPRTSSGRPGSSTRPRTTSSSAKLPPGSVVRDGTPAGHVSVFVTPEEINVAVFEDHFLANLGLKSLDEFGSFRIPK